jgi:isovaleryl-CoA dehydrogenase
MFMATLDFALGEDIDALREMVQGWAQERVAPIAADIDRDNVFPSPLWREMGDSACSA